MANDKQRVNGELIRMRGAYDRERIAFLQAEAEKAGAQTKAMAEKYAGQMLRTAQAAGVNATVKVVPTVTRGVTLYFIEFSVR